MTKDTTTDLLRAQEVADILKIARNTVYELTKRGELASTKVGKQVRITRGDVDAYLNRSTKAASHMQETSKSSILLGRPSNSHNPSPEEGASGNDFIICGQDISLDLLANYMSSATDAISVYRSNLGGYNGIYALYNGRVHAATAHLWDGDTDQYNVSYINKMMPGIPALIIRIGKRKQGLYVRKDNPKKITGWSDLKRQDIVIANREKGSGSRVLLDEKLRILGVIGDYIRGYYTENKSHLAVATTISQGSADVGVGSETGCANIHGVEFIPLQTECYDLVIRLADAEKQPFRLLLEIISSDAFKMDLTSVGGYDTEETGKIIWE